jgi:hypothetical protein
MIDINPKFLQVLDFVNQTNQSIFLTGKAGTGKTTLLRYIREKTLKQVAVVAPTGVAAINAGGTTIHSFFQFPFTPFLPTLRPNGELALSPEKIATLKYNKQRLAIFKNLELLVIDEISMVRADLLDQIDQTLRHTRRRSHLPFGGVQVLLIGDMYQLPPVVPGEEWQLLSTIYKSPFFFDSLVMRQNPPVYIELQKIYRQSDQQFIDLLNSVRNNQLDANGLALLNSHYKSDITKQDYRDNITLTTHNRKADEINSRNLDELKALAFRYKAKIEGVFSEKNYPNDEHLILKVGTRVMFLKNNVEKNYFNGKIGIVTELTEEKIKVSCEGDYQDIEVPRETWTNVSFKLDKTTGHLEEEVLGTYTHFPLRLAWAITIHKSQGLTFDKLIIDAAEAFSAGQVYVALSRCRSLTGLILSTRIDSRSLDNDRNILEFASARHDEQTVNSIYDKSRRNYLADLISNAFDFSEIHHIKSELAAAFLFQQKHFTSEAKNWSTVLSTRVDALYEVGKKFRPQLQQLLETARDFDTDQNLQQRLKEAAKYFAEEFRKCLQFFENMSINTDSKEAADDADTHINDLRSAIHTKTALLNELQEGFSFQQFTKAKLAIRPLVTRISVYTSSANVKTPSASQHPILFKKLVALRDEIVNETERPIYLIANTKTLTELSNFLPQTEDQLLAIGGFGPAKVQAFGNEFLSVIKDYCFEHNININSNDFAQTAKAKKKSKKEKKEKVDTKLVTLNLFREGKSVKEIALERNFTQETIERHLIPYLSTGEILIHELVQPKKQKLIEEALQKFNYEDGLNAIKAALPDDVTFGEIRFVMAHRLKN